MELTPQDFLFMDETKIMGFGESDTSGKWIKLQVHDLEPFRGRKGEILETALRLMQNDGTPAPNQSEAGNPASVKGGSLCRDAAILCKARDFIEYMIDQTGNIGSEESAKHFLCDYCGIESRRELDHNSAAAAKFKQLHREYSAWLK